MEDAARYPKGTSAPSPAGPIWHATGAAHVLQNRALPGGMRLRSRENGLKARIASELIERWFALEGVPPTPAVLAPECVFQCLESLVISVQQSECDSTNS